MEGNSDTCIKGCAESEKVEYREVNETSLHRGCGTRPVFTDRRRSASHHLIERVGVITALALSSHPTALASPFCVVAGVAAASRCWATTTC